MGKSIITDRQVPSFEFRANTKYIITNDNLNSLIVSMLSSGFPVTNPESKINSIKAYAFDVSRLTATVEYTTVKLGNYNTMIQATKINNPRYTLDLGNITIPKTFNNFMDYDPYTSVEIFLPYLGFFNLNTDEVIGKEINIQYAIDLDLGAVLAMIQLVEEERMIFSTSGKIGADIPFGTTNTAEITRNHFLNFLGAAAGTIISVASGGTASGIGTALVASSLANIKNSIRKYSKGTTGGGRIDLYTAQQAFVTITKPNPVSYLDADFVKLNGRPLGRIKTLSNLSGFTKVDKVHLTGFTNATSKEIEKIETLLKNGVHL